MADFFTFGSGGLQETAKQLFAKLKPLLDGKYTKPAGGIPASDMTQTVQTSLSKADTALQAVPNTYRTAAAQDVIDSNKAPVIFDTASGSVASFPDGADGLPLKQVVVDIEPVQTGTGDPSPDNVRPISGWTGCEVTRTGKNLIPFNTQAITEYGITFTPNSDGTITVNGTASSNASYFFVGSVGQYVAYDIPSGDYILSGGSSKVYVYVTARNKPVVADRGTPQAVTIEDGDLLRVFLRVPSGNTVSNLVVKPMLRRATETDPTFEAYRCDIYPVTFPASAGTVYVGKLMINENGTGELRARPAYESYNGETLVGPWISDRDVYAPGTTPTIGAQVLDLGGTESVYPLTAQQITALLGTNNIWADCGDVEVMYRADTKLFVDKQSSGDDVTDVQVAGTSIVQGGVANIPMASASTPGVVISGSVAVTGTTPTIDAQPGVRYVCGEVTTLDITLPASGIVDVKFESGSTATVLTITPPSGVTLKWANGFDPNNLAANTTYEIKVTDGMFGVADASGADSGAKSLGVTGAHVGDFVKVKAVDANGVPTAWEPYEWHHTTFAVTSEDEQTKVFTIENSTQVSEILVFGTVLFDSYDGFVPHIGDAGLVYNNLPVSSTNRYVGVNIKRTVNIWNGFQGASKWYSDDSRFISIARPGSRSNGIGNIRLGSMWCDKTMLVGTSLDVYWR